MDIEIHRVPIGEKNKYASFGYLMFSLLLRNDLVEQYWTLREPSTIYMESRRVLRLRM